jgi:hypothetical protein
MRGAGSVPAGGGGGCAPVLRFSELGAWYNRGGYAGVAFLELLDWRKLSGELAASGALSAAAAAVLSAYTRSPLFGASHTVRAGASTVEPGVMAMIAAACGGKLPTVPTKFGPIVRIGDAYACKACQKDAEVAAAKLPDHVIVELDRGPKNIPIQVGATGLVLA